jgi:hypothetical protein
MRSLVEKIEYKSRWFIRRFQSERDWEDNKVYRPIDAREMFSAPQFTVMQGGFMGAVSDIGLVFGSLDPRMMWKQFVHLFKGNVLLNEGINELWTILASASSGTKFDNTHAYIGVGDDSTAADPVQTGLNPTVPGNELYVAMDGGYPTYGTNQKATWRSTFTSALGNYNWREFTVANGNSGAAKNLNRKVSSQGTKASGQTWEITLDIVLS